MPSLRRLLKPRFLNDYLKVACDGFSATGAVAVVADGRTLAAAGDGGAALGRDDPATICRPLEADGARAGDLLVGVAAGGCRRAADPQAAAREADFLARSLQTIIDAEAARRAVTADALELYRELALLHRAAVDLNRSLKQADVAEALLKEFAKDNNPAEAGVVFWHDQASAAFRPIRWFGVGLDTELAAIAESPLFAEVIRGGKGEIVNDLAGELRWRGEVTGLTAVLIIPFMSQERCSGALVLATGDSATEFSAGDLKHADTLASVAAAALHNAELFEEAVEIKNFNESILHNLSNGVVTLDRAMRVTKTNAAAERILHRAGEDLTGSAIDQVFANGGAWVAELVAQVAERADYGVWLDKEIGLADGTTISVNLSVVPLENIERETIGYMLVFEDITREKRIKSTMVRFMSDTVVEKLLEVSESVLGGTSQEVTILFSDIRGFTRLSETLGAREMVTILNDYFADMVDVIFEYGGTLDKFIGDAIMAVFGAPFVTPDDTDNAIATATEMMRRLRLYNADGVERGRPTLDIGVGINTGAVVAGTIGSPKRMDYTVIGDHVNLASRIESANKYYGTKILISEHTLNRLRRVDRLREIDRVRVQGRGGPVAIYEILDYHTPETFPEMDLVVQAYARGLEHYRARQWTKGAACFVEALGANPTDRPTQVLLGRCWTFMAQPPPDTWTPITDLIAPSK